MVTGQEMFFVWNQFPKMFTGLCCEQKEAEDLQRLGWILNMVKKKNNIFGQMKDIFLEEPTILSKWAQLLKRKKKKLCKSDRIQAPDA